MHLENFFEYMYKVLQLVTIKFLHVQRNMASKLTFFWSFSKTTYLWDIQGSI